MKKINFYPLAQRPPYQRGFSVLKRLLKAIWPFWPVLLIGVFANMLYAFADAGFTYMLKPLFDKGFVEQDLAFVAWMPLVIFIGLSARGILSSLAGYCMQYVARGVVNTLRRRVFAHILQLPAHHYDNHSAGTLLSKILYDVEQIAQASADALTMLVQSTCLIMGLLFVMFYNSWQLTLLALCAAPFVGFVVNYTNRRTRRISHAAQQAMGQVTEIAEEAVSGYKIVRIFGGQHYENKKFDAATEWSRSRDMKVAETKAINIAGVQVIVAATIAIVTLVTVQLLDTLAMTAGGFISLLVAMVLLVKPLKNLTSVTGLIQRGLAGAESIFHLLDVPLEKDEGKQTLSNAVGKVTFDRVSLRYTTTTAEVLKNVSFSVSPGQTVALVGRSGSGKSSLVSLIPRFYEVSTGSISIDDVDIRHLSLSNLRECISLVTQQVVLFNDTIANNIAYGLFDKVTREQVVAAARAANVWEFAEKMPHGLDTLIGDDGMLLSGGQRQRIAIARAILKDAPILILDEATSALDTESELYIQKALDKVMTKKTTLVIAHRLSTVEKADLIIVLDRGKIVEQGTHQQLLAMDGCYATLYRLQFVDSQESAHASVD